MSDDLKRIDYGNSLDIPFSMIENGTPFECSHITLKNGRSFSMGWDLAVKTADHLVLTEETSTCAEWKEWGNIYQDEVDYVYGYRPVWHPGMRGGASSEAE